MEQGKLKRLRIIGCVGFVASLWSGYSIWKRHQTPHEETKLEIAGVSLAPAASPPSIERTTEELSAGPSSGGAPNLELVRAKAQVTALQQKYLELKEQMRTVEKELEKRGAEKPYEYDVTTEEWKDLAAENHVKYRVPCWNAKWALSDKDSDKLGLSPDEQKEVMAAFKRSGERMVQMAYTLCGSFMDRKDAIYAMGPEGCVAMAERVAEKFGVSEPGATARKLVAENKAGLQPAPVTDAWVQRLVAAYTAMVNEGDAFQKDLEASFGPEDAAHIWHSFPCARSEQ